MDKKPNLTLIAQFIDAAEKSLRSAKQLIFDSDGGKEDSMQSMEKFTEKAQMLSVSDGGKVVEGVFDGQNMLGPDSKQYPVPANYASKSKLIEGDVLKLTISEDGSFIYKQIGPVDRKKIIGLLTQDEKGDFRVIADGKIYRVLLASITYFKAEAGDDITIIVPEGQESQWAAVENVIKKVGVSADAEMDVDPYGNKKGQAAEEEDGEGIHEPEDKPDYQDEQTDDSDVDEI
jgi:hypothetical protein